MALVKVKDSQGNWTVSPIISKQNVYSTNEQIVGTWIDGKPIYRKTINVGALPNATAKDINIGMDFDEFTITKIYGIAISSAAQIELPHVDTANVTNNIALFISGTGQVHIQAGSNRSAFNGYVTVEYTKTTD